MPNQTELNKMLLKAASYYDIDTIKGLIDEGAEIDSRSSDGRTALQMTASIYSSSNTRTLLKLGADIDDDYKFINANLKALTQYTDNIYKLTLVPRPEAYNPEMDDVFIIKRLYHKVIKAGLPSQFTESLNRFDLSADTKAKIIEKVKLAAYFHALIHLKPLDAPLIELSTNEQNFLIAKLSLRIKSGLISQLGLDNLYLYLKDQPALKAVVNNALNSLFETDNRGIEGLYNKVNDCAEICLGFLLNIMDPETFSSEIPYSALRTAMELDGSPDATLKIKQAYLMIKMAFGSCLNALEQLVLNQAPIRYVSVDKLGHLAGAIEMLERLPPLILSDSSASRLRSWKICLKAIQAPPQASGGSMGAAGSSSAADSSRPKFKLKLSARPAIPVAQSIEGSSGTAGSNPAKDPAP
ncbi:MAG: hypothetical protein K0R66_538 [Gammaproteobacteria bacterium]|jgi:hypothetical protein|nr:hypothetical protein [Gammaproteobacteria bacterium]